MSYKFTTVINKEERWFVARCLELGVVSQGKTIKSAQRNLKEAVLLYLEGEPELPRRIFSFSPIVTTLEVAYA